MSKINAYEAIRSWCLANLGFFEYLLNHDLGLWKDRAGGNESFMDLIKNLPEPVDAMEVEMKAVLLEVQRGILEPVFSGSDGNSRMGDYAWAGLGSDSAHYSDQDLAELRKSRIWPFLITPPEKNSIKLSV